MRPPPSPSRFLLRFRRARAGVVAIEFALIGLILISVVVVAFEATLQLVAEATLTYGTRVAARFGITGAPYPPGMASNPPSSRSVAITDIILQASGGFLNPSSLQVQLTNYPAMPPAGSGTPGPGGPGNAVRYQATYMQPFATGLAQSLFGEPGLQHSVVLWVVNEPYPQDPQGGAGS